MAFRRLLLAATLLLALPAPAGAAGLSGWHPAAPLPAPLHGATATTLKDGDVLVAGGAPGDGRAAFLYDPAADRWSQVGSLEQGRSGHTATLLQDGRVLVAGGLAPDGSFVRTAELYDPDKRGWSSAGTLRTARAFHTATLIGDGRVLVAGGQAQKPAYPTAAELYDPAKNVWNAAGALATGRAHAAAALAGDGSVVLAGGDAGDAALRDAELFRGAWSSPIALTAPRTSATATSLLDGTVLLAGGPSATAETFDPATGAWTRTGPLTAGRSGQTATLLTGGSVLLAGGLDGGAPLASSELYDPASRRFAPAGDMDAKRSDHVAALLPDGSVLVAGGETGDEPLTEAERWTPPTTLNAPAALAFGGRADGTSTDLTVTVRNTGTERLLTAGAAVGGADFALAGNTCATVAPGAACALTIRFTPHAGPRTGILSFSDNTTAGTHSVALSGTGRPAVGFGLAPPAGAFVGANGAVTATVTEDGAPVAGRAVAFTVGGPNARTATAVTDAQGRATLTYAGAAPGADTITASYVDSAGVSHAAGPVTLTWRVAAVTLSPLASTGRPGSSAALTATLTEGGAPVAGRAVTFSVTAGPSQGRTATVTTGPAGAATFTYSATTPGTDTIRASFTDSGGTTRTATAARTWSDVAALLALGPESASAPVGATQSVMATLTEDGIPQAGGRVTFTVSSGPDAGTAGSAVTGPDGSATFSYAGAAAGTDTVAATAVDSAGRPLTANAVTRTWTAVLSAPVDPTPVDPAPAEPALPPGDLPLVAGIRARVQLVSGQVFVKLPGSALADGEPAGFVPLKGAATLPMGSVVDARAGTLALTTAAAYRGPATQTVRLSAAIFALRQKGAKHGPHKGIPRGRPYADLVLQTPAGAASACAHGPGKGVVRTLSGSGAGYFRTLGGASTATVSGNATWSVADRCDGTLTAVGRGRVRVLDVHTHRTRTVRAGQAFLVRARLFAARQR